MFMVTVTLNGETRNFFYFSGYAEREQLTANAVGLNCKLLPILNAETLHLLFHLIAQVY
jgi:hypothetical protein